MATRSKTAAPVTRSATRTKTPVPPPSPEPAVKALRSKAAVRTDASKTKTTMARKKPLGNGVNAADVKAAAPKSGTVGKPRMAKTIAAEREPIMAYLRIRPRLGDDEPMSMPYLQPLSDTSVRMTDPSECHGGSRLQYRPSALAPSSVYKFSHVFLPETAQEEFFARTTLPLVRDLLDGQNGLLFAYGVTNSGKTYTIQGRDESTSAGILPRTLDVLFNSIDGLHSDGRYRPVRLYGMEDADPSEFVLPVNLGVPNEPALAEVLAQHLTTPGHSNTTDPTVIMVDRNYQYSVWISYVEVYNEKVYDLLASVSESEEGSGYQQSQEQHPLLFARKALTVKPSPSTDASDESGGCTGRYISGMKQFRVTDAAQAKALISLGQLHRRVFGTLANSQSSRSHGMVIIKILKGHRCEKDDSSSLQMSRLTIVDLAGSERAKHTQTSGDRLKEAGNINKSLMVLGQCMEVMRANQKRLAQSLANPGRSDTRDVKKALAVVPFRHSKLTEILTDYFAGDGRVAMIVTVNPYDTGFEENSHVMKFSALAREISTVVNNAPLPRVQASPTKPGVHTKPKPSAIPRSATRKVTISCIGPGKKVSEAHLEVLEEDEEPDGGDSHESDDEPINPLVDALFDEIEVLRMRLYDAELRCVIVEAETREEVMKEMEARMREVERTYAQKLMSEVERNERKMDAKIDMLHQAGLLGTTKEVVDSDSETEISGLLEHERSDGPAPRDLSDPFVGPAMDTDPPSSPLFWKGRSAAQARVMGKPVEEAEDVSDGSREMEVEFSTASEDDDDDDGDYILPVATSANKAGLQRPPPKASPPRPFAAIRSTQSPAHGLEGELHGLSISDDINPAEEDSTVIVPKRKSRQGAAEGDVDAVRKKKRQLGTSVVTEEQVARVVGAIEKKTDGHPRNIRRMTRAS